MGKEKAFSAPLPLRAIYDERLAGLDIRVLAAVAAHDRMSLFRAQGQGCWTSHATLAAEIGCNYINLGKSLKKLGDCGYLERSKPTFGDKRGHVYRVPAQLYAHDESLSFGKRAADAKRDLVGQTANSDGELVCPSSEENADNSSTSSSQYISLSDETYSAEAEKHTHVNMRVAEAPRALGMKVLHRDGEPLGETLAKFERQFKADWSQYQGKLAEWVAWLRDQSEVAHDNDDSALGYRAQRLAEHVELFGWEIGEIVDDETVQSGGQG